MKFARSLKRENYYTHTHTIRLQLIGFNRERKLSDNIRITECSEND